MRKIDNPEVFRTNIQNNLDKVIKKLTISKELELGIYNYASKEANRLKIIIRWDNPLFTQLYIDRLRSIYINLKNPKLLTDLINNEITSDMLAFMTHQEMNAEHWKELIDMFTCKKCRSKKCTYYELQTRSADEPATIFVTCLDCGKNWKS